MNPIKDWLHFWIGNPDGLTFSNTHYGVWSVVMFGLSLVAAHLMMDLYVPKEVRGDYSDWTKQPVERIRDTLLICAVIGLMWPVTAPAAVAAGALGSTAVGIWKGAEALARVAVHIRQRRHD